MKTTNIVSTPNITGNIGSCSTSATDVIATGGILTDQHEVLVVNSCTGDIVAHNFYMTYSGLYGLVVAGVVMAVFIFGAFISSKASNNFC